MKHWIIYEKLDTRLSIHINLPASEEKDVYYLFKQDLTKKRHYLVIKQDQEEIFLILTITSKEKATWGKFGPIKCPCLDVESYISLNTKILISQSFAYQHNINLGNKEIAHSCLNNEELNGLKLALATYWKKIKKKLFLLELGTNNKKKK